MSEKHPRADLRGPCGERVLVTQNRPSWLACSMTATRDKAAVQSQINQVDTMLSLKSSKYSSQSLLGNLVRNRIAGVAS